jgi:hypothetical protein
LRHGERINEALGNAVSLQLARDLAAKTVAKEDPLLVRAAAPVLGHTALGTTERHYQQATALQAQRALGGVVARVRMASQRGQRMAETRSSATAAKSSTEVALDQAVGLVGTMAMQRGALDQFLGDVSKAGS